MRRFTLLAAPLFALGGLGLAACHSGDPYTVCDDSMPNTIITYAIEAGSNSGYMYCQGVNSSYGGLCWTVYESTHQVNNVIGFDTSSTDGCPV